jgi:hypothetical protein
MKKRHELCLDEYYVRYVNPKGAKRPSCNLTIQPVVVKNQNENLQPNKMLQPKKSAVSFADWKYACRYDCKIW